MKSTLRAVAESRFATITRREETAKSEADSQLKATQEKTARLKALRLARDSETPASHAEKLQKRFRG